VSGAMIKMLTSDSGRLRAPRKSGCEPFRWATWDDAFPAEMVEEAAKAFPRPEWDGWVRYDSPGERKLAGNERVPPACAQLIGAMNAQRPEGLVTDPSMHGAGMHMMPSGGWLDLHLDCDAHPRTRYRRAVNAILFLDPWHDSWGGALEFWTREKMVASVTPQRNRLVVFEVSDASIHGIPRPIASPEYAWRRSLAVYWWEPKVVMTPSRPRAEFMTMPGEAADPEKEKWQRERSGFTSMS